MLILKILKNVLKVQFTLGQEPIQQELEGTD